MTLTDIAKWLNEDHGQLPPVIFITDQQAVPYPEKIILGLPQGSAVILRDYDHPARAELGVAVAAVCRENNITFLVAGDLGLAEILAADGVHLPQRLMAQARDIRASHPNWVITVSCHDYASVMSAGKLPIDAGLIAPVFATHSHPETFSGQSETLGLKGVRKLVEAVKLPLYALGGVTNKNARQLIGSGLVGIAAIRGFGEV